jgi:hypothetical protein
MAKTVQNLVYEVHQAAVEAGMDLSPSDVGFYFSRAWPTTTLTFRKLISGYSSSLMNVQP